jgi:radical SAM superfamily enzyme YgiQ (UPF0313 family)
MRVLLVSANTETVNMPTVPWGLTCVAAATRKKGHDVSVVDLLLEKDPQAAIEKTIAGVAPDVIGVSVRNIDDQNRNHPTFFLERVKQTVAWCRRYSAAPIVLGGAGYSIFPEASLEYLGADMGIQGEGEMAFPELLRRLQDGTEVADVPGLYRRGHPSVGKREHTHNLDELPMPDAAILAPYLAAGRDLWLPVQTRRGCSMRCSYCSTGTIEGFELRRRSPDIAMACLSRYAAAGFRRIYFVDNNFSIPASHALDISRKMAEMKLDIIWRCILNPMQVDEELVGAMAEAGCREVSIGFESGCERILHNMNKHFSLDDIRRAARLLSKHGMRRMGFLLLGGPGETKESVLESLAFAESLALESLRVTAGIRIYPNTPLAKQAVDENVIAPEDPLLFPRFYFVRELEGWIETVLAQWKQAHPEWII